MSKKTSSTNKNKKTGPIIAEKDFDTRVDEIMNALQENYQQQKKLMNELKELKTVHNKDIKVASGKPVKNSGKHSGFNRPQPVPAPLRKLLNIEEEELSRPAVAKLMYQYFKDNNMCNEKNKKEIIPNRKIREIFGMKENDVMNFENLQTWLKKVYQEHSINENVLELQ